MPVVFHSIIGATREQPGDEGPLVPMYVVSREKPIFFLVGERPSVDPGIELVKPSQPATLSCKTNIVFLSE